MAILHRDSSPESLSREIADAAQDLVNRINLGEFDDLDEGPMLDLRCLSEMMEHWAGVAQALQERLALTCGTMADFTATRPPAIRR